MEGGVCENLAGGEAIHLCVCTCVHGPLPMSTHGMGVSCERPGPRLCNWLMIEMPREPHCSDVSPRTPQTPDPMGIPSALTPQTVLTCPVPPACFFACEPLALLCTHLSSQNPEGQPCCSPSCLTNPEVIPALFLKCFLPRSQCFHPHCRGWSYIHILSGHVSLPPPASC